MSRRLRSIADFACPSGRDLLARTQPFHDYFDERVGSHSWFYGRSILNAPTRMGSIRCADGDIVQGVNFGSQDYLSLGTHPAVQEAAIRAIRDYGPHSAGSPCAQGGTPIGDDVERALAELLGMEHVLVFPTGWAAGYGSVVGLVRDTDHVVMDRLAHNCLQSGAFASTRNVRRYDHNDPESLRRALARIRSDDPHNGVLVLTEGLYSMDSDVPDVYRMQTICDEFDATLLVDVAHDLGAMGPGGTGTLGLQGMLSKVDLVMGSFSKTFGSNGGFLASRRASVKQYVRYYGSSHMFSNAMSPMQSAVVREALRIVRSTEGDALRDDLMRVVLELRSRLERRGVHCMGVPSAIVPVLIGREEIARTMHDRLNRTEIIAQFAEFPVVAPSKARIRMQMMAGHSLDDARLGADRIAEAHALAIADQGEAPSLRASA